MHVDSHGKRLTDYPRPSVAVDTAVLSVVDGALVVALVVDHRTGGRRLPGTFLHAGERLADAVRRSLAAKAGLHDLEPVQLGVLDDPERDDRGWVLSVAHLAVVPASTLAGLEPAPVAEAHGLDHDHDAIVDLAVARVRADHATRPDPNRLLGEPFPMTELRELHEAVAGERLQPDTFRRWALPWLVDSGEQRRGTVGKPAALFTHPADPAPVAR
ncbi:NUDIX hydrolase [Sanguibacter sp. HDW7]|uniref:NUDIX hydrolase n=1 Tax=Sanguibacter sp. HDW7 TaxID=2714931 RepID=UPI00140AF00C|nr:NUDIX hydrolase [Sanguibacter sp. HDW7]QIK84722.1 NUDIX hydrolase [Sanguibacter sp. HDW7]